LATDEVSPGHFVSGRALSDVERAATDRAFLQQSAYADSTKLRARVSIYEYRDPPGDIWAWVIGLVDWPDEACALDAGCGPGGYLARLRDLYPSVHAIGVDLSRGMAAEAARHAPTVNADVAHLPLPDEAVDRVLAPHMLYHCPDIPTAITELRRVLKPGGSLVAVTNAHDHLQEMWDVYASVTGETPSFFVDRFDLASGDDLLRDVFADVRIERSEGTLLVTETQPVVDYLASTFHFADRDDDTVLDEIGGRVQAIIDADGVFSIRTRSGAFVCR
jgi:SAM-dependent methyltransferase